MTIPLIATFDHGAYVYLVYNFIYNIYIYTHTHVHSDFLAKGLKGLEVRS